VIYYPITMTHDTIHDFMARKSDPQPNVIDRYGGGHITSVTAR
jgi:hypothetical protein